LSDKERGGAGAQETIPSGGKTTVKEAGDFELVPQGDHVMDRHSGKHRRAYHPTN